jgi:hypothetical protein
MNVEEICKLLCQAFRGPRFRKAKILVVSELAEIFADDVLEVIEDSGDSLNFVAADLLISGDRRHLRQHWCSLSFSSELLGLLNDFF